MASSANPEARGDEPGGYLTLEVLEAAMADILQSPRGQGALQLIVRRPQTDERETLMEGQLDPKDGLVGDSWRNRGGTPNPDAQLTVMNARVIALLAQDRERWPLAGDQLFVDFDLSAEHLPPGSRLAVGSAVIEVSEAPHNGCKKFAARYGKAAVQFVNSPVGKQLHLRGINARVVQAGGIRMGDVIKKL